MLLGLVVRKSPARSNLSTFVQRTTAYNPSTSNTCSDSTHSCSCFQVCCSCWNRDLQCYLEPLEFLSDFISQDAYTFSTSKLSFRLKYRALLSWIATWVAQLFRLSLLIVGNLVCLVLLCLISARRDKVCPLYRVWNWTDTNTIHTQQKLYRPLENIYTISPYFFWAKLMRFWRGYVEKHVSDHAKASQLCSFSFWHER